MKQVNRELWLINAPVEQLRYNLVEMHYKYSVGQAC